MPALWQVFEVHHKDCEPHGSYKTWGVYRWFLENGDPLAGAPPRPRGTNPTPSAMRRHRTVALRRLIAPPHRTQEEKKKRPQYSRTGAFLHEEPGSDLLWHGLQPHYHRRRAFSLPSSEWDRVVPARYCRQANRKTLCLTLVAFANA